MVFLYEPVLYLLIIPILIFIFIKDKNHISQFINSTILSKITVSKYTYFSNFSYKLFILYTCLLIIALSRPAIKEDVLVKQDLRTSLIIAIDLSKSMKQNDIYPSRIDLAKQKLNSLVKQNLHMNIGVILFTKYAYSLYPVSFDTKALSSMIKFTNFHKDLGDESNIFAAIEASKILLSHYKSKNILLFSDGGNSLDMNEELKILKKEKISLYAINISLKEHKALKILANQSDGNYENFSFGDDDINNIINYIQKKSQKEKRKQHQIYTYKELFIYPLALAMFILIFLLYSRLIFSKKNLYSLLIISLAFSQFNLPLQANLLDFYYISKAEKLYKDKKYQQSIKLFENLDKNLEITYNLANALYKATRYKEAIQKYKELLSTNTKLKFKILHNIANSYVKLDKLYLAKKYYEKSLKINKNSLSKENLKELLKVIKLNKKAKKQKKEKGYNKLSINAGFINDDTESKYEIELKNLVNSEEELWFRRLEKETRPSFLQKIKTSKRSKNASFAW